MSRANARQIAQNILDRLQLPADLAGYILRAPAFRHPDVCRSHYPQRSLEFHQRLTAELSRLVRKRRGRLERVYLDQLHADLPPSQRRQIADQIFQLAPQ